MVRHPVTRVPPSRRQYVLQSPALQAAPRLPGAKAGPMTGFVEPSLATLRPEAPRGDRWVHEIKYDGCRLQLHLHNGSIRLFTRRGHNWTDRFESIVIAASSVKTYAAILDGEVIVPTEQGRSDFHALERDLGAGRSDRFVSLLRPALSRRPGSARVRAARPQGRPRRAAGRCSAAAGLRTAAIVRVATTTGSRRPAATATRSRSPAGLRSKASSTGFTCAQRRGRADVRREARARLLRTGDARAPGSS